MQDDSVEALFFQFDDAVDRSNAQGIDVIGIVSGAARHDVASLASVENVVAISSGQLVVTRISEKQIITARTRKIVLADPAQDGVVSRCSQKNGSSISASE